MIRPNRQSSASFRLMSLEFRLRDWLRPPVKILQKAGAYPGMTVLDFGCGPGGFSLAAARLVGPEGRVISMDIHPMAVKTVLRAARKQGLRNIHAILGKGTDDLASASIDLVLLYDVLHDLPEPAPTLAELHRVLNPSGVLSVGDHHMKEALLVATITNGGLYRLAGRSKRTFRFEKLETCGVST
jgi:ubiquinone/menaquinone biosynthesis C-methylase UbiE